MGRLKSKEVVALEPFGTGIDSSAYNVGMSKNAKRALIGGGLALALGYMIYLTTSGGGVSCEVCVEFRGSTECRKAFSARSTWPACSKATPKSIQNL